jgi:hypothetical protein
VRLVFNDKLKAVIVLKSAVVAGQRFCFDEVLSRGETVPATHGVHAAS